MKETSDLPKFKFKPAADVQPGDVVINLGRVIEKDDRNGEYVLVISRQNQKQVFTFGPTENLMLLSLA